VLAATPLAVTAAVALALPARGGCASSAGLVAASLASGVWVAAVTLAATRIS
jgi:hypothetical protein